jgi:hypothetical protein
MRLSALCSIILCSGFALAGQNSPSDKTEKAPIYRVTVEQRTVRAINYGHRSEPTRIDFRGTVLLPLAKGEAKVESRAGAAQVDSKFEGLEAPTRFGAEYLTYVLWAITPEGRPVNLGEIMVDGSNKARLKATSQLQAFGLIVTAEPYFAVTQPSNVVVLENMVRPDTVGAVEEIEARYELLPRAKSPLTAKPIELETQASDAKKIPQDQYEALVAVYQAQNALQIARADGADRYAADTFAKAEQLYEQARKLQDDKAQSKRVVMTAREAAQAAGDAHAIAVARQKKQ